MDINNNTILTVNDLSIQFMNKRKAVNVVDDLSFDVKAGDVLGIVGESGCGKTVTSLAIMRLLPGNARISSGRIICAGKSLLDLTEDEMCDVRGNLISIILQDPMTALNPTATIGKQLIEPFMIHQGLSKDDAWEHAISMLRKVGISSPENRMREYPHQMSGGMLQRIVIATALACKPKVLIADEPTTALEVTIQAQILDLIKDLCKELGTAVILITHDMGVVAEMADDVLVLYSGRAVEYGSAEKVFRNAKHPYTKALLRSIPSLETSVEKLNVIPGTIPVFGNVPAGCRFEPRCEEKCGLCAQREPDLYQTEDGLVRCFRYLPQEQNG